MPRADAIAKNRVRHGIYERDGWQCVYCGSIDRMLFVLDHVIPKQFGGPTEEWNLVLACTDCNSAKGSKLTRSALDLWLSRGGDPLELLERLVVEAF